MQAAFNMVLNAIKTDTNFNNMDNMDIILQLAKNVLHQIKNATKNVKYISVDCGNIKYNVEFKWSSKYKAYINTIMNCVLFLNNDTKNLKYNTRNLKISKKINDNNLYEILKKNQTFKKFLINILGNSLGNHKDFLNYLINVKPIQEYKGWVYVYCRLEDMKRKREVKFGHVILHKIGLTRRHHPTRRIVEQEIANDTDYNLEIAIGTKVPHYFERIAHLFFAKQRVKMHNMEVDLLDGGTEWFLIDEQQVILDMLKVLTVAKYVWRDLI